MADVTIRVIDGSDRGRVFEHLPTPVTIGREEGNSIQLNDERVSRFHIKIQDDNNRLVLTDLQSTNGTKVNGEDIQLRILKFGDMITLGRSVLLFGSQAEIADRLERLRRERQDGALDGTVRPADFQKSSRPSSFDFELNWSENAELQTLRSFEAPQLPEGLSPGQAAQLGDLLSFLQSRVRGLVGSVKPQGDDERVSLELAEWQGLLDLQARITEYLRQVGEPGRQ